MATLVAYFSAEGTTARVAKEYAEKVGADVFEIVPETPYTRSDINYLNPLSRCNKEQIGGKEVPVAGSIEGFDKYDTVYLGFPIWYGQAPRVMHTLRRLMTGVERQSMYLRHPAEAGSERLRRSFLPR